MKRCAIILFACFLFSAYLSAQFRNDDYRGEFFKTYGPIKHMTTIVYADGKEWKRTVEVFDTIGITESYVIDESGVIIRSSQKSYQYTDSNSCLYFYHKNLGDIRGSERDEDTIMFYFNAKGDKTRAYDMNSNLVDSFVYDTHGRLIEKYHRDFKTGEMKLKYESTYDSLGRLVKEKSNTPYYYRSHRSIVKYKYLPNGNYKRYYTVNGVRRFVAECFVNDKGQLVKLKFRDFEVLFSQHDRYGNWLKYEMTPTRSDSRTVPAVILRSIEYFE